MLSRLRGEAARAGWSGEALALAALLLLQAVCALFFLADVAADIAFAGDGNGPLHNAAELAAALALAAGVALTARETRRVLTRQTRMTAQLRVASGAFHDLLEERFEEWALTPSERDVALLSIKGLSIAEIAAARSVREGTVKAQSARIYAKAGVTGRLQLLSLFIDELMEGGIAPAPGEDRRAEAEAAVD